MSWIWFPILAYSACAVNLVFGVDLAWNDARPDFLLLLAGCVALSGESRRAIVQVFLLGVLIDFSGPSRPGIYATSAVLAAAILRPRDALERLESPLRTSVRLLLFLTAVPALGLMWEGLLNGVSPAPGLFVSRVLMVAVWTLACGVLFWLGLRILLRLLPHRGDRWSIPAGENNSFFLAR